MKTLLTLLCGFCVSIWLNGCRLGGGSSGHSVDTNASGTISTQEEGNHTINEENLTEHKEGNTSSIPSSQSRPSTIFGSVQPPKECTLESKKKFVYDVMHDSYLWAEETPKLNYMDNTLYPDDSSLLHALRYFKDRFSFIMDKKAYDNFFEESKNIGFGLLFFWVGTPSYVESIFITLVYPGSPAQKAGLKRSDEILTLDGHSIDEVYHDDALTEYYFLSQNPITVTMKVRHQDGVVETISLEKEEYEVKTVIKDETHIYNGKKVGYLMFQSFVATSKAELDSSFADFKREGIDELVLDLRYNGGGYIYIARHLASLIGGKKIEGEVFEETHFNPKYSYFNYATYFETPAPVNSLDLKRLFVLTTDRTCSASELIINGLRASVTGVEVIQIGKSTCGKPYGMIGGAYCDRYLLPVQTRSVNADGVGDYVDGIVPHCFASDDIYHPFGDPKEELFASALYYISHHSCPKERHYRMKQTLREMPQNSFRGLFGLY